MLPIQNLYQLFIDTDSNRYSILIYFDAETSYKHLLILDHKYVTSNNLTS